MKISHFLAKICHFGGHFEFSNFSGIKSHRRSNIMTDSVLRQMWPLKQPVSFQICQKSSNMPNPTKRVFITCDSVHLT